MPASGVARLMLGSRCAFGGGFLAIALVEAIDASCGIDQLLLAGKERVASRTNFNVQVTFLGRASLERLAARAGDGDINVFWVNSWFHLITLYKAAHRPRFQTRHFSRTQQFHAKPQSEDAKAPRRIINFALLCLSLRLCVRLSSNFFPKTPRPHTLEYCDHRDPAV